MNHDNKQAKVVLVTGAAKRIGASIVQYFHKLGFRVVIHCHRSVTDAHRLADELNQQRIDSASVLVADLSLLHALPELIQDTVTRMGRLDVLVNNASLFTAATDAVSWEMLFHINVRAPFYLSHAAYPYLTKTSGNIINITDIHSDKVLKGYSVYCQSKAALVMQTKSLAREFAPHVRVNAVAPGAIMWPEHDNALTKEQQQRIISKTPLQRHGEPLFIAEAVFAFVNNPFITGQTLSVDGGRTLV